MIELLSPPASPVYSRLPPELYGMVDRWTEDLAQEPEWEMRGHAFVRLVSSAVMTWSAPAESVPFKRQWTSATVMITAVLEDLGETEIVHPGAAIFYALAGHDPWRAAARRVLDLPESCRYLASRSDLMAFVKLMQKLCRYAGHG